MCKVMTYKNVIILVYTYSVQRLKVTQIFIHSNFYQQHACKFLYVTNPFHNFGYNNWKHKWVIPKENKEWFWICNK
jgi:hypothetical protein